MENVSTMKLEWNKIISNAVTVLVATVFVGAATYLWREVQTIDQRIDTNLSSIRATQNVMAPKVDRLETAIQELLLRLDDLNATRPEDAFEFKFEDKPTIESIKDDFNREMQQIPSF